MNIPGLTTKEELTDLRQRVGRVETADRPFPSRRSTDDSGVPTHQVIIVCLSLIAIITIVIWRLL